MKKRIILNFMMFMAVFSIGLIRQPMAAASSLQRMTLQNRMYNAEVDEPQGENAAWGNATPEEVVEPWM